MLKSLIFTAAATALLSTAAYADPVAGGTINVAIQPEPPGLMLGVVRNGPTQMVSGNIYESLLRYNTDLEPQAGLAKEWTISKDGLTYTFFLNEGVKWHDGAAFSSADVVFSADVMLRETNPQWRRGLEYVASVTAPDDNTVVFKMTEPFGPFITMFEPGTFPVVPKHLYEGTDFATNENNATPVGTGPFKFQEWEKGSYIHLVKNEDYYVDGLPYLDEIYWQVIPDAASRSVAFETGKLDVLPGGSVENFDIPRLTALDNVCSTDKGWEYFAPHSFVWMNNRAGPTADVKFRQAVMYAMDREFMRDVVWNGFGKIATGPISSRTNFYDENVTDYSHDPDKARALLEEIGYDGTPVRILPLPYGETWTRFSEVLKQNLEAVGVTTEIVSTDVAGWNQKLSDWDFDLGFTYLYQYGDPALGVSRSYVESNIAKGSPWNNVSGYVNAEADGLFAEAALEADVSKRQELYTKAQQLIVEDAPVAWTLEIAFPTVHNCNVQDLVTTAIGVNDGFRNAWIKP